MVWHIVALWPTKLTQVMEGLVKACSKEASQALTGMLEKLADSESPHLACLFWCKSGTHRSVALAQAYGWVLVQLGAEVIGWVR